MIYEARIAYTLDCQTCQALYQRADAAYRTAERLARNGENDTLYQTMGAQWNRALLEHQRKFHPSQSR